MTDSTDPRATSEPRLLNRRAVLTGLGATGLLAGFGVFGAGQAAAESSPAPTTCRQLITVNTSSASATSGSLSAWQRATDGSWHRAFGPMTAHVGSLGVGRAGEGSQVTPAGTFPLDVAFGRLADPGTAMPYFRTDPLDWWDENPSSPNYNLHVRRSASPGGNSENLYYSGAVYDYAVNINHNPRRVPYAGSGIFLHVTDGGPTAGCVSIGRSSLAAILRWLRPDNHPYAAIRVGRAWAPLRVPAAQADKFVTAVYLGALGRPPTAAYLRSRSTQIQNGAGRRYVADQIAHSDARYRRVVQRVYRETLGRDPGASVLSQRAAAFAGGGRLDDLYAALSGSTEAWQRSGQNAARWVQATCVDLIGRPTGNPAPWVAMLRTRGRPATVKAIAGTAGFGAHQLDLVFKEMLGRTASVASHAAHGARMRSRGAFDLPGMIAEGAEFWARSQR